MSNVSKVKADKSYKILLQKITIKLCYHSGHYTYSSRDWLFFRLIDRQDLLRIFSWYSELEKFMNIATDGQDFACSEM